VHLPFWVGTVAVLLALGVFLTARGALRAIHSAPDHNAEPVFSRLDAEAVTVGDA
jgi:hypothetical protein